MPTIRRRHISHAKIVQEPNLRNSPNAKTILVTERGKLQSETREAIITQHRKIPKETPNPFLIIYFSDLAYNI